MTVGRPPVRPRERVDCRPARCAGNEPSLHLCERGKDVQGDLATRDAGVGCAGVDRVGEGPTLHLCAGSPLPVSMRLANPLQYVERSDAFTVRRGFG